MYFNPIKETSHSLIIPAGASSPNKLSQVVQVNMPAAAAAKNIAGNRAAKQIAIEAAKGTAIVSSFLVSF